MYITIYTYDLIPRTTLWKIQYYFYSTDKEIEAEFRKHGKENIANKQQSEM